MKWWETIKSIYQCPLSFWFGSRFSQWYVIMRYPCQCFQSMFWEIPECPFGRATKEKTFGQIDFENPDYHTPRWWLILHKNIWKYLSCHALYDAPELCLNHSLLNSPDHRIRLLHYIHDDFMEFTCGTAHYGKCFMVVSWHRFCLNRCTKKGNFHIL